MIKSLSLALLALWIAAGQLSAQEHAGAFAAERAAGAQLKLQLDEAIRRGQPQFTIPPGTYRLSPDSPDLPHLLLKGLSHFELIGRGVTLICETKNTALSVDHCRDVRIEGLTIDYDPLPMTQGVITAVGAQSLDFIVDAGYDAPDYDGKGVGHLWVADGTTRQVRAGSTNYGGLCQAFVPLGGRSFRLMLKHARKDSVQVGDRIKIPQRLNLRCPHAVRLYACSAVTLRDVTIESAPCFGFVSTWGDRIALDHVRVMPGPPPAGATEPRIFSSSADGINLENDQVGPTVRNCSVISNGDDGIAIYNAPDLVLSANATLLTVGLACADPRLEFYSPGDTLRFFTRGVQGVAERRVVAVQRHAADPATAATLASLKGHYQYCIDVTLDAPIATQSGDRVLNTRYAGRGFAISGNVLTNNASRGINVNQSSGTVDHNTISHSFLPGIHMTEFLGEGSGSGFQTDVTIHDNRIIDACVGYPQRKDWQGAISIVSWKGAIDFEGGHSNIAILHNEISQPNGPGIQVSCGSNITISQNVFTSPGQPPVPRGPAILLDRVRGATIEGNSLVGGGWDSVDRELQISGTCEDVQQKNALGLRSSAP